MKKLLFISLLFFNSSQALAQRKIRLSGAYIPETITLKEGMWINYAVSLLDQRKNFKQPEIKKGTLTKIYRDSILINYHTIPIKKLLYLGRKIHVYPVNGDSLAWKISVIEP
jgi:hypothetical protein